MFDSFVIVDWSAANQPKLGRDSIWLCAVARDGRELLTANPKTRHEAKTLLAGVLEEAVSRGERVLLGFDFPFGYPAGFAQRLGLNGGPPWRGLWDEIARLVEDAPDNRNNRFRVGAELNRRVSNGSFPFWGCPPAFADAFLGARHHRGHSDGEALQERRVIDRWMVGAQPCWKLAYTGSVGSQSLTGIPVVRELRGDPRWADRARIWPFETGLAQPEAAQIVFAEVWPSWWRSRIRPELGPPNDKAQVRSVAALFVAANATGELAAWFAGDPQLTHEQREQILAEEAWTLGVTAPRRPDRASILPRAAGEGDHAKHGGGGAESGAGAAQRGSDAGPAPLRLPRIKSGVATSPAVRGRNRTHRAFRNDARSSGAPSGNSPQTEGHRQTLGYLRDPAAIYRQSFATIRSEADLSRFPAPLRPVALRLAHAAGDVSILDDLQWSRGAGATATRALAAGAPILVDSAMVAAGIGRDRLPAGNQVICTLREPEVAGLAAQLRTTRSAAAVELWRPHLDGAVVAIGNAPTALFHLLDIVAAGAPLPALVLGFPVGFVGAAEAKAALAGFGRGLAFVALAGRRGGSALAAAAVNAFGRSR